MFFKKNKSIDIIYQKIVFFSRDKIFYTKYQVPDSIDGRFDILALITIIFIFRLSKIKPKGPELSQVLFDCIFKDLDYSLRELGAGDVSVSTNMRKFISSYMGRQKVYIDALKKNDVEKLMFSIKNNIFRNTIIEEKIISLLSKKILEIVEHLNSVSDDKILDGDFQFFTKNL